MARASVRAGQAAPATTQAPYEVRDQRRGTGLVALLTSGAEGDDGAR